MEEERTTVDRIDAAQHEVSPSPQEEQLITDVTSPVQQQRPGTAENHNQYQPEKVSVQSPIEVPIETNSVVTAEPDVQAVKPSNEQYVPVPEFTTPINITVSVPRESTITSRVEEQSVEPAVAAETPPITASPRRIFRDIPSPQSETVNSLSSPSTTSGRERNERAEEINLNNPTPGKAPRTQTDDDDESSPRLSASRQTQTRSTTTVTIRK